jgi:tetratricopeptide (TPR) repeat protein
MPGRRVGIAAAVVTTVALLVFAAWSSFRRPIQLPAPREAAQASTLSPGDFVGAERCAQCHVAEYDVWAASTHGRAGGAPSSRTVVAPFGRGAIVFANARVTPRVRAGAYEFVVERAGDPTRVIRVVGVLGAARIYGGGTQGFLTREDDGTIRFLPFEWSRQAASWFCNTNSRSGNGWTPITPTMRIEECADWPPARVIGDHQRFTNCQSCHASQATLVLDTVTRRYETHFTSLAINCESCHGPGRRHVELATSGAIQTSADIGMAALDTRDKDGSSGVCYQCHALKDRLRDGFVSGEQLSAYYSTKFPLLGDRSLTPDGRVRTFAYQEGQQYSDCYLNGGMACTSCHDPHTQTYRTVTGETLRDRFDDRQCTSCHLSKAADPPAHTKHASASVRCTSCHMPERQEPATRAVSSHARVVMYARSDHTISIPRPAVDSALGLVSACSACHAAMSLTQQERQIRAWWGEIKPMPPVVAAQVAAEAHASTVDASAVFLADTASSTRNTFAQFAGVSRFLETQARPDAGLEPAIQQRLRAMAASTDVDVRAAALAALHLAAGSERGTRRALAAALRAEGDHDLALRSRWALALGYMGDRYVATGDLGSALIAYGRALDVRPSHAALLMSRANAQRDGGDLTGAIASYQSSLAIDQSNSLAWVNFGIALSAAGDTAAAITAFMNATTVDPSEPLGWFNLGNIAFVRGSLARADSLYQRAAVLNPSIAQAQFQLARVRLMSKDYRSALSYLRRGLAFDSSDAAARQAAADLAHRLERFAPTR